MVRNENYFEYNQRNLSTRAVDFKHKLINIFDTNVNTENEKSLDDFVWQLDNDRKYYSQIQVQLEDKLSLVVAELRLVKDENDNLKKGKKKEQNEKEYFEKTISNLQK